MIMRILRSVKIYCKFIRMNFLAGLEYKGWWLMFLQVAVQVATNPVSVLLLFSRFGAVGDWSMERIMLVYSLAVTSFGLAESFCRGFDYFPWRMIRTGEFDRVLLRPRSLFVQIIGSYFHIHRLARPLSGMIITAWSLKRLGVPFTPLNAAVLLLALLGGLLTYCGVFVLTSGIAFFTISGLDWIYILTNASYYVANCPVDYMPRLLRNAFTFFVPMLVVSYYPASFVCGWGERPVTGFLALPAGAAFLGLSVLVWRFGVRHYKSTGN